MHLPYFQVGLTAFSAVGLVEVAAAQGNASAPQTPPRSAAPAVEARVEPAAYADPRWWGIAVSICLGGASIYMQVHNRRVDQRRSRAEDEFDTDIGDPLRDTHAGLRGISSAAAAAALIVDAQKRRDAITKIREEQAAQALSPYSSAAFFADTRLQTGGHFVALSADLEDTLYEDLSKIEAAATSQEMIKASKRIESGVNALIYGCTERLRVEKDRFQPKKRQ